MTKRHINNDNNKIWMENTNCKSMWPKSTQNTKASPKYDQ